MWKLFFTKKAEKTFLKLDRSAQKRIKMKLDYFISSGDPIQYAKKLVNPKIGTYRFRIWEYRVVFDIDEEWKLIILLVIDVRWQVYKDV